MKTMIRKTLVACLACYLFLASHPASAENNLLQTIRMGDYALLRAQLKGGASVSDRDKFGNTPLHIAALRGDAACIICSIRAQKCR